MHQRNVLFSSPMADFGPIHRHIASKTRPWHKYRAYEILAIHEVTVAEAPSAAGICENRGNNSARPRAMIGQSAKACQGCAVSRGTCQPMLTKATPTNNSPFGHQPAIRL